MWSLLVTWQRWRPNYSIRRSRKPMLHAWRRHFLQSQSYCRLNYFFLIAAMQFLRLFAKNMEILKISCLHCRSMQMASKHAFRGISRRSRSKESGKKWRVQPDLRPFRPKVLFTPTRCRWPWSLPVTWRKWRPHHSIAEKIMSHANIKKLSNFSAFLRKNKKKTIFRNNCLHCKAIKMALKDVFRVILCSSHLICAQSKYYFIPTWWAWSHTVTSQSDDRHNRPNRKPCATRKHEGVIFCRAGVIVNQIVSYSHITIFAYFCEK